GDVGGTGCLLRPSCLRRRRLTSPIAIDMKGGIVRRLVYVAAALASAAMTFAQDTPDWSKLEEETMRHYQALLRLDTSDPPGKELPAAEYLKQVFDKEGIPAQ